MLEQQGSRLMLHLSRKCPRQRKSRTKSRHIAEHHSKRNLPHMEAQLIQMPPELLRTHFTPPSMSA